MYDLEKIPLPKKYTPAAHEEFGARKPPKDHKIYACIRNPYDRITSTYYKTEYPDNSFSKWLLELKIKNQHLVNKIYPSQHRFFRILPNRSQIFRFEEFNVALRKILNECGATHVDIPHMHADPNKPHYKTFYTKPAHIEIVSQLCKWDLDNLLDDFDVPTGDLPEVIELRKNLYL
jgi:hypothetical protein